jgi:cardiolipin synthase
MHRIFKKDQILTVPNLLSVVRLALIPIIIWLYCTKNYTRITVLVILISGITDILDGFIARHFNMTSDFGKILDPVADKLTQAAVAVCLISKYKLMYMAVGLFVIKEIIMASMGCFVLKKKDAVNSAKWYGKANTVVLYSVMMLLILFPNMPNALATGMILLCCVTMVLSLALYMRFYVKLLSST